VALPVPTRTFEVTSQQAQPGDEAAGVRVEHRVPDGSRYGNHNLVCAGPALSYANSWRGKRDSIDAKVCGGLVALTMSRKPTVFREG
jgi:hypothetical protein